MRWLLGAWLLLAGCAAEPASPDAATRSGEELVELRCGYGCHGLDWVARARGDEATWSRVIDRMIGYGATVLDEERAPLIAYLVATFGE